jgi:hypothetical protein
MSLDDSIHPRHMSGEISGSCCPECGGKGQYRRGYEYEGEKICLRCDPSVVWCPGLVGDYFIKKKPASELDQLRRQRAELTDMLVDQRRENERLRELLKTVLECPGAWEMRWWIDEVSKLLGRE